MKEAVNQGNLRNGLREECPPMSAMVTGLANSQDLAEDFSEITSQAFKRRTLKELKRNWKLKKHFKRTTHKHARWDCKSK